MTTHPHDIDKLRDQVRDVVEHVDPATRKALLQSLIEEIKVVDRSTIEPVFSLLTVRPPSGSAQIAGLEHYR